MIFIAGLHDYLGCRVVICNLERNETIANTTIVSADRHSDLIVVRRTAFSAEPPQRVSVLIFFDHTLYECLGTVRKSGLTSGLVELALYRGKNKDGRMAKRYTVNAQATVHNLIVANKLLPLRTPLTVLVVNMSTGGCLIRADSTFFNLGSSFQLTLGEGEGDSTSIRTKVLRVTALNATTAEYGCKFLLPKDA